MQYAIYQESVVVYLFFFFCICPTNSAGTHKRTQTIVHVRVGRYEQMYVYTYILTNTYTCTHKHACIHTSVGRVCVLVHTVSCILSCLGGCFWEFITLLCSDSFSLCSMECVHIYIYTCTQYRQCI